MKQIRIKRPRGFTIALRQERQQRALPEDTLPNPSFPTEEKEKELEPSIQLLLNHYILNGNKVEDKYVSPEELSVWLKKPAYQIMKFCNEMFMKSVELFHTEEQDKSWARGSIFNAIKFSLETYHMANNQAKILITEQGNNYVPFLTSEVNRSIRNSVDSIKPIIEISKTFLEKQSTNLNGPIQVNQNNYLTKESAMELIQKDTQKSLLLDPNLLTQKAIELVPENLPEIDARKQGMSASEMGAKPLHNPLNPADRPHREEVMPNPIIQLPKKKAKLKAKLIHQDKRDHNEISEILEEGDFLG